jgi:hypothetical protein
MTNKEKFLSGHKFKSPIHQSMNFSYETLGDHNYWIGVSEGGATRFYAGIIKINNTSITIRYFLFDKRVTANIPYAKMEFIEPLTLLENANN